MPESLNQFLNKRHEKGKRAYESMADFGAWDGFYKTLSSLYPDNAHFVFELLQNAEDAKATKVRFELSDESLTFKHNGKTKRWWVLHDNWQKMIDKHYDDNKDNPTERYKYMSFAEWLKINHNIGNGEKSFTDSIDGEFHTTYVWLARLDMGRKMQKFFKQNPKEDYLTFQAEC